MNTVVSLLLLIVCSAFKNTTEYTIAYYLLENIGHICDITRVDLCNEVGVSNKSLSNFCKMLGHKKFSDLKLSIIKTVDIRKLQMKVHLNNMDEESLFQNMCSLADKEMDVVGFRHTVDSINAMIHDSKKVVVIGAVYPEMLSLHYMEDMLMFGKFIFSVPVSGTLCNVEKDALVLMISFTGRVYIEHYEEIVAFKKNNIPIIGIGNADAVPKQLHLSKYLTFPFTGDNERENAFVPLVLQYMKYRYYIKYGEEQDVHI